MRTVLSLAVLPLLIPLQSITAQQGPPIETGSRIRVTAPALGVDKLVGTSVEADATQLLVQVDDQAAPMTISSIPVIHWRAFSLALPSGYRNLELMWSGSHRPLCHRCRHHGNREGRRHEHDTLR